jgi:hypothetical protein
MGQLQTSAANVVNGWKAVISRGDSRSANFCEIVEDDLQTSSSETPRAGLDGDRD